MCFSTFTFNSTSFTVKWVELLTFTLKTRNTVARENRVGLLDLLNMETRTKHTFTCENGLDLLDMQSGRTSSTHGGRGRTTAHGRERHDLLNRNLTFFTLQGRKASSTDGRRGRTNADGRERHGLLNMRFFNKANAGRIGRRLELLAMRLKSTESRERLRGSGMGMLARLFFTFKSKTSSEREAFAWA